MPPPPFQLKAENGKKMVSSVAMKRLKYATDAIKYTKGVLKYGAGNQVKALKATNLNSLIRHRIARNEKYWRLTPEAKNIADKNISAYKAARAEVAQGGTCGEHSNLAYQYLRYTAKGEEIARAIVKGIDHTYALIGPAGGKKDMGETAVADPWPTKPKAVLWEDHFSEGTVQKPGDLLVYENMVADGGNPKELIKQGLTLIPSVASSLNINASDKQTSDLLSKHEKEKEDREILGQEIKNLRFQCQALKDKLRSGKLQGKAKKEKVALVHKLEKSIQIKSKLYHKLASVFWDIENSYKAGHDYHYHDRQSEPPAQKKPPPPKKKK